MCVDWEEWRADWDEDKPFGGGVMAMSEMILMASYRCRGLRIEAQAVVENIVISVESYMKESNVLKFMDAQARGISNSLSR